jgi:FkbH-like protein
MFNHITAQYLQDRSLDSELSTMGKPIKLAILGYRNMKLICDYMKYCGTVSGIEYDIYSTAHTQVEIEVFNLESELHNFQPDVILILHSYEFTRKKYYSLSHEKREFFHVTFRENLTQLISVISQNHKSAQLIIDNFEDMLDEVHGNNSFNIGSSLRSQIIRINSELLNIAESNQNVHVFDKASLITSHGLQNIQDSGLLVNIDVPYKIDFEAKIAWGISQMISASIGNIKKCLIIDLDNTLWGGIIGDDGLNGIQLGGNGIGAAFKSFQFWIKELAKKGIIIAVCSKNEEDIALKAFINHPEMVLTISDVSIFKANWNNKAENIELIKNELNISFDSIVFLDDSKIERELIKLIHPSVVVPELPKDPAERLGFLRNLNLFESTSTNTTDRAEFYRENSIRSEAKKVGINIDEFLNSLELKSQTTSVTDINKARVSELSLRANQFNLRTIRYSENDIEQLIKDDHYYTYCTKLEDKYGSYGLVSVIVLSKKESGELFIENWFMSCRALQLGVEKLILNAIAADFSDSAHNLLIGEYIASGKNALVESHYPLLGFTSIKSGLWRLDLSTYSPFETYISSTLL